MRGKKEASECRGGPGEKQIELDRRMLGQRIKQLKIKLTKLEKQRANQRMREEDQKYLLLRLLDTPMPVSPLCSIN